jgi:hypothetical protein
VVQDVESATDMIANHKVIIKQREVSYTGWCPNHTQVPMYLQETSDATDAFVEYRDYADPWYGWFEAPWNMNWGANALNYWDW